MFMLHSSLLHETVQLAIDDRVLILNSAADPFVLETPQRLSAGELILAEDDLASLQQFNNLVGADVSRPSPIMNVNTKIQQSLGADLSCPPPIYRPQLRVRHIPFLEYTLPAEQYLDDIWDTGSLLRAETWRASLCSRGQRSWCVVHSEAHAIP